ncbi:MAG: hypothetical protein D3903_03675 [Candidatus Electrothrix sp. GM3_4]|nr:hypothetical protein [Candidatus Electrothrix sp. GM3_4]
MKNQICSKQNDRLQLQRLAAQRQMYADAKRIQALQLMLSVPVVIAVAAVVSRHDDWHVYAALYGVIVVFVDLWWVTPKIKRLQNSAARIQQLFDVEVLDLDWNEFLLGNKPAGEEVSQFADRYEKRSNSVSNLRNWYSLAVAEVDIEAARILCQRANLSWDIGLRRRYASWLTFGFITLCSIVTLIGITGEFTLTKLILTVIVPLQPALLYTAREIHGQREARERLERLIGKTIKVWDDILNSKLSKANLKDKAHGIQNALLDHRQTSPLIFDWIYTMLCRKDEDEMMKSTEYLTAELRDARRISD